MVDVQNKQCPICGEYIPVYATKCEFCNEELVQNEECAEKDDTFEKASVQDLSENNEQLSRIEEYASEQKSNKIRAILIIVISAIIGLLGTLAILYKIHSSIDVSFNVDKTKSQSVVKDFVRSNSNIEKAKKLYNEKDIDNAAKLFQEEIDNNNNPVALYYMGEIYKDQDFTKIAIEYYKQAIDNKSNFFEPNKRLAEVYYSRGEYFEAQVYGEKALAIKPKDLELLKTMVLIYDSNSEVDKLIATYIDIVELEPKNIIANGFLAIYNYRNEDYKTAAIYISNLLDVKYDTDIAYTLVNCYVKIEYYTKAIEVLNRIIENDAYEYYRASNIRDYVEELRAGYNRSHGRINIPTSGDYRK